MAPQLTTRSDRTIEYEGDLIKKSETAEVLHIPVEGRTACYAFEIPVSAMIIDADAGAERFHLCDDCAVSYDPVTGLSTPHYRERIEGELEADRLPEPSASAFNQEQMRELFQRLSD